MTVLNLMLLLCALHLLIICNVSLFMCNLIKAVMYTWCISPLELGIGRFVLCTQKPFAKSMCVLADVQSFFTA